MNRSDRIRRVRAAMAEDRLETFFFADPANIFYLSGFRGSDGALLLTPSESVLLVDGRYGTQAQQQAPRCRLVVYKIKVEGIAEEIKRSKARRVGFESQAVSVDFHGALKKELPRVKWVSPSDWLLCLRSVKDPFEIALLRRANRIADLAFRKIFKRIRAGARENDLALEIEVFMKKRGAERASFPISVASGGNSSLPHARAGNRRIRKGEPVFIDFGCSLEGYQTDQTVTFFLGKISKAWKEIYSIVKEAHGLAIASLKPGMPASEVDWVAREFISKRGFGDRFTHSLGHGVGIEVHEYPAVSAKSEARLGAGMVFTIEPGIYIPGEGGIRIEDTIHLTSRGVELLTSVDKGLRAR